MPLLLLIVAALITYGSLYPFAFDLSALDGHALDRLLTIAPLASRRGDILGNVVLFVPFGLVGVAAADRSRHAASRAVLVLTLGLALAVALQVAQLFVPSRVPTLSDVVWNGLGLLLGALAAALPPVRRLLRGLERAPGLSVPALLIAAWLAYRLAPFVPSIDFQLIKDSLKPLLLYPRLTALGVFHDLVAWSVVLHLWAAGQRGPRDPRALLLIAAVFLAELFIIDNAISADNLAGAALAVVAWWLVLSRMPRRAACLAGLLLALVVLQGLAPFALRADPAAFRWAPFAGVLEGATLTGLVNLLEKLFLYGSLIWLLIEARLGWTRAALGTAGLLGVIELAQTRLAGHTPEITDPLLALLIAVLLAVLSGRGRPPSTPPRRGGRA